MRLLLCERAGLLLSNLVVPYETTRITGAATVYMGFVPRGGFFQLPTQYDTRMTNHAVVIIISLVLCPTPLLFVRYHDPHDNIFQVFAPIFCLFVCLFVCFCKLQTKSGRLGNKVQLVATVIFIA